MTDIIKHEKRSTGLAVFSNPDSFEHGQRIAKMLASSDLVPAMYKGNVANTLVAIEMSNRMGVSALAIMQNMHVIEGKPTWSSPFVIAAINSSGLFSPLRYKIEMLGEKEVVYKVWEGPKGAAKQVEKKVTIQDMSCIAWATDASGETLEGPPVTISMAVAEGWYFRKGSKWPNMPKLMIQYRAASFFGRTFAPETTNGMLTTDEAEDFPEGTLTFNGKPVGPIPAAEDSIADLNSQVAEKKTPGRTKKTVDPAPIPVQDAEVIDTPAQDPPPPGNDNDDLM